MTEINRPIPPPDTMRGEMKEPTPQPVSFAVARNQTLLSANTEAINIVRQMLMANKTKEDIIILGELIIEFGRRVI